MINLTPYEARILSLIASGKTNQEIGAEVFRSPRTIEGTLCKIREKTDAKNTIHLVVMAVREGVI